MLSVSALLLLALPLSANSAQLTANSEGSYRLMRHEHEGLQGDGDGDTTAAGTTSAAPSGDAGGTTASETTAGPTSPPTPAPTPEPITEPASGTNNCCGSTCTEGTCTTDADCTSPEKCKNGFCEAIYETINACPSSCAAGEKPNVPYDECTDNAVATICCQDVNSTHTSKFELNTSAGHLCWGTPDVTSSYSPGGGSTPYQPGVNWKQADTYCKSLSARLCTMEEIRDGKGCNSGCDFDCAHVWVSDAGPCFEHGAESYHTTGGQVGRCYTDSTYSTFAHGLSPGTHPWTDEWDSRVKCCNNTGVAAGHRWKNVDRCTLPEGDPGLHTCGTHSGSGEVVNSTES